MCAKLIHTFGLKCANKRKPRNIKISRLCTAIVIKEDNKWFCNVIYYEDDELKTIKVPLSKNSLELKGKTHIFTSHPDSVGRYVCLIRSEFKAKLYPGSNIQYSVVKHGCVIVGKIISTDDDMVFEYEALVSTTENTLYKINNIVTDDCKPLFK